MEGIGVVDKIWEGHTTDRDIRLNSASGGIVTASLVALLESGKIDGAIVNIADLSIPPRGKRILAKTKEDVMQSSKSIFCTTEINRGLRLVNDDLDIKKVAVVGLPCQISRIRETMKWHSWTREKIILLFGIMCGHNIFPSAVIKALKMDGIDIRDVKRVTYRAKGWYPFFYSVEMKNGSIRYFSWPGSSLQQIWDSLEYQPPECLLCSDFAAEAADIACCDAWLEKHRGNQEGFSLILTHTSLGTKTIEELIESDTLTLIPSCIEDLYESNYAQIDRKLNIKKKQS